MSTLAEELLENYTLNGGETGTGDRIIIGNDRLISIPENMRKIAVQYDHNIETITFTMPRYWDGHDMSKMRVYVNYMRSDDVVGSDLCTNVVVNEEDESLMNFNWTITGHLTAAYGPIAFLVCVKNVNGAGNEENHWNSELCKDAYISEGLECEGEIIAPYPGLLTAVLNRMDIVENKTTDEAIEGYIKNYIINNDEGLKGFIINYLNEHSSEIDMLIERYLGDYAYYERVNVPNIDPNSRVYVNIGTDISSGMIIKVKVPAGIIPKCWASVAKEEGGLPDIVEIAISGGIPTRTEEMFEIVADESTYTSYMFSGDWQVYLPISRTDPTLGITGMAADSKVVGDRLRALEKIKYEFDEATASLYITIAE